MAADGRVEICGLAEVTLLTHSHSALPIAMFLQFAATPKDSNVGL
jgi:hypothetical protein